jgi:hypothetical protein
MNLPKPLVLAAAAATLLAGTALPASAATIGSPSDTTATFTIVGGDLTLAVGAAAALGNSTSGDTSITGSLGTASVSDARGDTASWTVSAASTTFVLAIDPDAGSTSTATLYTAAQTAKVGTVTLAYGTAVDISGASAVVTATAVSGNNSATWTPTLDVTMPSTARAGAYSGTVTTSII